MQKILKIGNALSDQHCDRRTLLAGGLSMLGLGFLPETAAAAEAKADPKAPPPGKITPPPTDVNELSMEVAVLRTLYLLKAGPDQQGERSEIAGHEEGQYRTVRFTAKGCTQTTGKRQEANASKNYVKVLTDLRAAFIAGQVDRINELSGQLDELAKEEEPDLDDTIEITDQARKNAPQLLGNFNPDKLAGYLAAYGKDFPDPWLLMFKTMRLDGKGKKPTPEQWKETRAFVIKEVSWQVGGLDLKRQEKIGEEAAGMLDKAYTLSNEELKKQGMPNVGLRRSLATLIHHVSPTDPLKHVLEQDVAELLSNPRLLPAMDARLEYLKKPAG